MLASPAHHVLLVSPPLRGHAAPMLALAEELVQRGHRVSFAISAIARDWVDGTGATWVPWDLAADTAQGKAELDDTFAQVSDEPVLWRAQRTLLQLVARTYEPLYRAAQELYDRLQPDLVVIERGAFAAIDAAYAAGLPYVTVSDMIGGLFGSSPARPRSITDYPVHMSALQRVANALLPVVVGPRFAGPFLRIELARRRCGLRAPVRDVLLGAPMIVAATDVTELPCPLPADVRLVGPVLSRREARLDEALVDWLDEGAAAGVVYAAFGTLAVPSHALLRSVAQGLARTGQRVLWSLPELHRQRLPALPERIRVEPFVPQTAVLRHPSVRAYFGHGGTVSTHDALLADRPILALPFFGNQHYNAARIVDRGVGLRLDKRRLGPDTVCERLGDLLGNSRYAEAARRVGQGLRKLRGRDEAADVIERSMNGARASLATV